MYRLNIAAAETYSDTAVRIAPAVLEVSSTAINTWAEEAHKQVQLRRSSPAQTAGLAAKHEDSS